MDGGERDKKIPPVEPEQEKPDSESAVNAASETSEPETPETAEAEGGQEPSEVETAEEPSDVDITEEPAAKAAAAKKPAKAPVTKKKPRPVKKKGPVYEDLEDDPLAEALREHFGDSLAQAQSFLDQKIYTVSSDQLFDIMLFLRDRPEWAYDYLIDVTVLDYLGDEKRFCLIYHLYSYPNSDLIRVKSRLGHDEVAPSMTSIWKTADWLEREAYDMFGVEFSGHPDLRRILLPEDWHGFPLRKDYDIKLQDQAWIKEHLRIRKVPS